MHVHRVCLECMRVGIWGDGYLQDCYTGTLASGCEWMKMCKTGGWARECMGLDICNTIRGK